MEIFSAAWVIPVTTPVIGDGSVVIDNGRIIEVGSRADILNKYHGIEERRYDSVLMPGLVNTHMHLELSHLSAIEPPPVECGFTAWISELMRLRQNEAAGRTQVIRAFSKVLGDQYASGVALVADIGNEFFPELYGHNSDDWPEILRMIECLAPNRQALAAAKQKITDLADCYPACVHAPYSSSSDLLYLQSKDADNLAICFPYTLQNSWPSLNSCAAAPVVFVIFSKQERSGMVLLPLPSRVSTGLFSILTT